MDFTDADIVKKLGTKAIQTANSTSQASEVIGGMKQASNGIDQAEKIIDGVNGIINKIFTGIQKLQEQKKTQEVEAPRREPQLILNEITLEARIKDFISMLSGEEKEKVEKNFEEKKSVIMPLLKETIKDVVRIG
jgi:hypothetical protein